MPKKIKYSTTINNKKYEYSLRRINKNITHLKCDAANIDQEFLNEDVPGVLIDLPNLILAEEDYNKKQDTVIRFRVNMRDKHIIKEKAMQSGYNDVSSFLRSLVLEKVGS